MKHLSKATLAVAVSVAALHVAPAMSAVQTWDFDSGSQSFSSSNFGNSLSLTSSDGVNLTVTGWSDSFDTSGADEVDDARLLWANSSALGVQNRDENTGSPNHAIDNITSDSDGEFDMLLLNFDTAVNLTGIDLNWAVDGASSGITDISILAYDGTGAASINGSTWADILSSNGGNYDSAGNHNNVGLSYYTVNPTSIVSTDWLVGVYNPVFGSGGGLDGGDDGMKLSLITTETAGDEPPVEVPVPGSAPLLLLGFALLRGWGRAPGKSA